MYLLIFANPRYGALENSLDVEKAEHKEEIKRRNEAIKGLKKELDTANDLIKTMKNKGLTEDDVERLSPSAAAASKLRDCSGGGLGSFPPPAVTD